MNHPNSGPTSARLDEEIARDLQALKNASGRNLPATESVIRSLRNPARQHAKEGAFMSLIHATKRRPWLATGMAVAIVVIALLTIPIPYDRTVGHDVSLKLTDAAALKEATVLQIARELKSQLGAEKVSIDATNDDGRVSYSLAAYVPRENRIDASAVARGFASSLESRGYRADAAVTPRIERVSGSVYAMAQDQVIRVASAGKTAAQIEDEIREKLADAGIPDARVSVIDHPDNTREITVDANRTVEGGTGQTGEDLEPGFPEIIVSPDGQGEPGTEGRVGVKIRKTATDDGTRLTLEVQSGDETQTVEIENPDQMTDSDLAAEVQSRLDDLGIQATVEVHDGQLEVVLDR
jgi:hypothetical protein